jgi:hypothetical protein
MTAGAERHDDRCAGATFVPPAHLRRISLALRVPDARRAQPARARL